MADGDLIGEIRLFPYDFVPVDWLPCNGQALSTDHYPALFAIIGNAWGGDGLTTFCAPNLNHRAAMHVADGQVALGQLVGSETASLNYTQLPPHSHVLQRKAAANITDKISAPTGNSNFGQIHVMPNANSGSSGFSPAPAPVITSHLIANGTPNTTLSSAALTANGGYDGHENRQPYLVLIHAICTNGMFPQFG